MILVGNARGGAKDLALHLMKEENEHVEVFEISGFVAQDLRGALNEAYALSRATRCEKFLYATSFNPPPEANVSRREFVDAVRRVEKELGLAGQPRVIVFHEKEGPGGVRRHAHAVWSRIDTETMKAIRLPFDRKRLNDISRQLFINHEWALPDGYLESKSRNPKNFTLEEWQQAKRVGKDPRQIKTDLQNAWAVSDSKTAFSHALEERGYILAKGDRRSFVAVDVHGEIYSIPRMIGVKTKSVRERLGDEEGLPDIDAAKARHGHEMLRTLDRFSDEISHKAGAQRTEYDQRRKTMVARHRLERTNLKEAQGHRWQEESLIRQDRFRTGFKGLWDRLRGEHGRIKKLNEAEAELAIARDRSELEGLTVRQLGQRRNLRIYTLQVRKEYDSQRQGLDRDKEIFQGLHPSKSRGSPEP